VAIVNRRNAVLGWVVWTAGKTVAKQVVWKAGKHKAKEAVPGRGRHAGLNKSAIALIAATIGSLVFFWLKKSDGSASG
jgi:hypothetical protein